MSNPIPVFRVWQLLPVPLHLQAYEGALPRLRSAFDGRIWELPGWTKASCSAKSRRKNKYRVLSAILASCARLPAFALLAARGFCSFDLTE